MTQLQKAKFSRRGAEAQRYSGEKSAFISVHQRLSMVWCQTTIIVRRDDMMDGDSVSTDNDVLN